MIYIRLAGLCSEKMLLFMECRDDEVLIITICHVSHTQSSFSSSVTLASLLGCLLFNYRLRRPRKISCLLARYLQTMKREGMPVTEAVSPRTIKEAGGSRR